MSRRPAGAAVSAVLWEAILALLSQENVEITRRLFRAETPEEFRDMLHPEVEFHPEQMGWTGRVLHGPEEVGTFFHQWIGTFKDYRVELTELVEAADSVIVEVHQRGRGKGSGAPVEVHHWDVITLRDGKVVHWASFRDRDSALAAAS
jgi:ketosteroid isomerase-like protein